MSISLLERYQRLGTKLILFITGFSSSSWAVVVPYARANTGVNEATLGTLLLCLGGGALLAMPLTGYLTAKYNCKKVIRASVWSIIFSLPLLSLITSPLLLAAALLIFGTGIGITAGAINIQSVIVEKKAGKPLMSGFHSMYSCGGIAGAGLMTVLLSVGISISVATAFVSVVVIALLIISQKGLLTESSHVEGPTFAKPKGIVLWMGIICFSVFLAEGTVLDWSAVFLTEIRDVAESNGGLGFATFALAMTFARLIGDRIITGLGAIPVVIAGALIAAAGFALVLFIPDWKISLAGYALVGLGCANIVPVMFSAAGRQAVMSAAVAIPAVTTMGYLGVLAGPAIVGYVAHFSTLPAAFICISVLMILVALMTLKTRSVMVGRVCSAESGV